MDVEESADNRKRKRGKDDDSEKAREVKRTRNTQAFQRLPNAPVKPLEIVEGEELQKRVAEARRKKKDTAQQKAIEEVGLEEEEEEDEQDISKLGELDPTDQEIEEEQNAGIALEAFNLESELNGGVIDIKSGTVNTRRQREEDDDEPWLREFETKMKDEEYRAKIVKQQTVWQTQQDDEAELVTIDKNEALNEVANVLMWGVWKLSLLLCDGYDRKSPPSKGKQETPKLEKQTKTKQSR